MVGIVAFEGSLGAEVRGWQPDRDLSDKDRAELLDALDARLVLVVRGQPRPTDDQIARLAHSFGEVYAGGASYGVPMPHPDVLQVSNELGPDGYEVGIGGSGVLPWHTDYSFLPVPGQGDPARGLRAAAFRWPGHLLLRHVRGVGSAARCNPRATDRQAGDARGHGVGLLPRDVYGRCRCRHPGGAAQSKGQPARRRRAGRSIPSSCAIPAPVARRST